ncbi:hypothetical protein L484_005542 [Morus notabilis]|uniref:Uncharacterized protein n=1 Tax=Morus notabilis TaxID=981085 RepID=W9QFB0_9ROSA|nr:hypothetical protein L484_005542 [Morus notabilis]
MLGHEENDCKLKSEATLDDAHGNLTKLYGRWMKADSYTWLWWPAGSQPCLQLAHPLSLEEIARYVAEGTSGGQERGAEQTSFHQGRSSLKALGPPKGSNPDMRERVEDGFIQPRFF